MSAGADNNWKTKMLLTEHHEHYDNRGHVTPQQPTSEEFKMIRDYTILPHMLTMIQRNLDDLKYNKSILNSVFLVAGEEIAKKITKDLYEIRRELSKRNIRVSEGEQDDIVLNFNYTCRGYTGTFGITREESRAQISIRLGKYVSGLIRKIKEESKQNDKERTPPRR